MGIISTDLEVQKRSPLDSLFHVSGGLVGLGTNGVRVPISQLELLATSASTNGYNSTLISDDASPALYSLLKSRGSIGAEAAIQAGDVLGEVRQRGHDGISMTGRRASMSFFAPATWTNSSTPLGIFFETTDAGSTEVLKRMYIHPSGNISAGTSVDNGIKVVYSANAYESPSSPLAGTVAWFIGEDDTDSRVFLDSFGATGKATFTARCANGTAEAPTAVTSGQTLATFGAIGRLATTYGAQHFGSMTLRAKGNFTDTSAPTSVVLRYTATGSLNPADGLTVDEDGTTSAGRINAPASTTARASLNIPLGVAPTSPVAGDVWYDGAVRYRDASATREVAAVEAGTFTPVLTAATPGDLAVAYTTQLGNYVKIGTKVTVWLVISTSSFTYTTASSDMRITGLPFTSNASTNSGRGIGALLVGGLTKAGYTSYQLRTTESSTLCVGAASGSGVAFSFMAITDFPSGGTVVLRSTLSYSV